MKRKKDEVYFDERTHTIVVNGQKYREEKLKTVKEGRTIHIDKVIFKPINEIEEADLREQITKKIVETQDKEVLFNDLLNESFKFVPLVTLRKIKRIIDNKTMTPKIQKQHGCLGIEFDNGKEHEFLLLSP